MLSVWQGLKARASRLKREVLALWFCRRHPDTPWAAKLLLALVLAYALSPIDLIPDFVPVLGYLDELILLPGAIWLVLRMMPEPVLAEGRRQAEHWLAAQHAKPRSYAGAALIVGLWIAALWGGWLLLGD